MSSIIESITKWRYNRTKKIDRPQVEGGHAVDDRKFQDDFELLKTENVNKEKDRHVAARITQSITQKYEEIYTRNIEIKRKKQYGDQAFLEKAIAIYQKGE